MKLTLLLQVAVDGCHFWVIFAGEYIPIVKNVIRLKKCAHALSTFRHLCTFSCIPTLFPQVDVVVVNLHLFLDFHNSQPNDNFELRYKAHTQKFSFLALKTASGNGPQF